LSHSEKRIHKKFVYILLLLFAQKKEQEKALSFDSFSLHPKGQKGKQRK